MKPDLFETCQSIVLKAASGQIFGVLHLPLSSEIVPAVAFCHGLGGNKVGRNRLYVRLARRLTEVGIAAFRFDFRGAGDSSGELHEATMQSQVQDILHVLEYLSNSPPIDANRLALFGRSLGGALAVQAASQWQKIVSLALWAPVFDGKQWLAQWRHLSASSGGMPSQLHLQGQMIGRNLLEELIYLSLAQELESLRAIPMLHIHGLCDEIVSIDHAEGYAACRQIGLAPTRFLRFPLGDHDFNDPADQKVALKETTQWFQDTLINNGSKRLEPSASGRFSCS